MKKTLVLLATTLLTTTASFSAELSRDQQQRIIENFMHTTGQRIDPSQAAAVPDDSEFTLQKCGTPAILDYYQNFDRLDPDLREALGVHDVPRTVLDTAYGLQYTLIHYDTSGIYAPWQVGVDNDHDGTPDYIEALAEIADSCYIHIVDSLGFEPPLTDSICDGNGGDGRIDIYLQNLQPGVYGFTYNQTECYNPGIQHEAAWVVIENDFQALPQYVGRPLDAARVTIAHELFHVFHFSLDATEHASWFEMSSVWMEEEIYDEINDYYYHDSLFFRVPWKGLQDTTFHMYQSVVWPIYLTEKYDRGIVRAVWEKAADYGQGRQYLQAFDDVIDSVSRLPQYANVECLCYTADSSVCLKDTTYTEDLASALAEFAIWNYFTGPYTDNAPDGIGYSEAKYYDFIPIDSMVVYNTFPITVGRNDNYFEPQPNGAVYIRLENLQSIDLDSLLSMFVSPDPNAIVRWGVSGIYQLEDDPDSNVVVSEVVDVWETWICTSPSGDSCLDSTLFLGRYAGDMVGDWVCTDGEFGHDVAYCDSSTCYDSSRIIDLRPYRSFTLVMTPSIPSTGPYGFGSKVEINYSVFGESLVDAATVDLSPSLLTPYPNPAVVNTMNGAGLTFRLQAPTDAGGFPDLTQVFLRLEIYTVAGELVRTIEEVQNSHTRSGPRPGGVFDLAWDMKNEAGNDIASGVYLAVVRMYEGSTPDKLLVTDQTKVAVIR